MSHYTVGVFTKQNDENKVIELLAPYDENMKVDRYRLYTKQELIAHEKELINQFNETERFDWQDEQIYQNAIKDYDDDDIGANGEIYSTYNPNSKWDWYSICNQFDGNLLLKEGQECIDDYDELPWMNCARVREIDFDRMEKIQLEKLEPYEEFITKYKRLYKEEYLMERYPNKESYILQCTKFKTYAVITPDGNWYAPGTVGWFGVSTEEPEDAIRWARNYHDDFIKPAIQNDWWLTLVDCHI